MEAFGNFSLDFALYVHVADPSVVGRVKHRIHRRIQDAFNREGIEIPYPVQTMVMRSTTPEPTSQTAAVPGTRIDAPVRTPPEPHLAAYCPPPATPSNRGVDE
jgi:small-conductance mechanosensitive channel